VRQSPTDANRLFFDFDAAAPGGRGGASVRLDPGQGLASIDGVHKNVNLPPRSTGDGGWKDSTSKRPRPQRWPPAVTVRERSSGTCSRTRQGRSAAPRRDGSRSRTGTPGTFVSTFPTRNEGPRV